MLTQIVSVLHLIICIFLVLVILLQQGKGADMGATFGGGGNTLFGASGADTILIKVTTITAILFMCTSVYLAISGRTGGAKFQSKLFPAGSTAPAATLVTEESKPETGSEAAPAAGEAAPAGAAPAAGPAIEPAPAGAPAAAPVQPAVQPEAAAPANAPQPGQPAAAAPAAAAPATAPAQAPAGQPAAAH